MSQPTPQLTTPRPDRAERTRQRILEAAGLCFAASGYARTTVEAIAARAGVSKGIVYHHFRGKEQILERVLERTLDEWSSAVGLDHIQAGGGSLLAALAEAQRRSLAFAREHPLVRSLFQLDGDVLLTLASSRSVREAVERSHKQLVEAIRQGIARGELRSDLDPERTADVVRLHQMALIDHLLNPEWIEVSDELVETGLDLLFHGMGAVR